MKKKMSKTNALTIAALLVVIAFLPVIQTVAADGKDSTNQDSIVEIILTSFNEEIQVSYEISGYIVDTVEHEEKEYKRYSLSDESNLKNQGFPDLPNIRRSIIIPDDKKMTVEVINQVTTEYNEVDIIPSKGILPRTINPDDVPFKFDEIYEQDTWYPESIVKLDDPYILRDFRSQVIQINPVQYNPVQHKIRVLSSIEISISEDGPAEKNILYRDSEIEGFDRDYETIYSNHFLNYKDVKSNYKYDFVFDQGNMLVITYDGNS